MNINAKVGIEKQEHPERFCPQKGCLWRTAKLNHETQQHEGGGYCPRHKPVAQATLPKAEFDQGGCPICGMSRCMHDGDDIKEDANVPK